MENISLIFYTLYSREIRDQSEFMLGGGGWRRNENFQNKNLPPPPPPPPLRVKQYLRATSSLVNINGIFQGPPSPFIPLLNNIAVSNIKLMLYLCCCCRYTNKSYLSLCLFLAHFLTKSTSQSMPSIPKKN